ncbi:DUF4855 domain-containing protein [Paenibacillus flagellatus]|uniref:F5/8 type C domain-containing protein n=1 Tax=Paenibacillus flagellatus TaxID=2211139 RepID=A0A2V5K282_9BACL|nr:DUF4855 domain-containing protein [Paenibacillus flagellatus]PYI51874.1 hypothetical protein DLM86_23460 [Paenibacillus flagellatus]
MGARNKWAAIAVAAAIVFASTPHAQAEEAKPAIRNLAAGLDYQWSEQPEASRPDGARKLTDGKRGALNVSDPAWVGHVKGMTREVTFDLGGSKSISQIKARFLQDWPTNETLVPLTVSMYVSDDNVHWGLLTHKATQLLWGDGPPRDETYAWDGAADGIKSKPGASMAYARYVKVAFSMHTRAHTLIDEIEIAGADGKLAGAEAVPAEPVGLLPPGEATGGIRHLALFYNGHYPQGKGDWSKERIVPNISYVNRSGEPTDWMFDGVLYLGLQTPEGRGFNGSANLNDWTWYLNKTFAAGGDMDQLNAATAEVGAKLNDPAHKTKVVLMIPDPGEWMTDFGDVDGDGVSENFNASAVGAEAALCNRAKAIQWYVDQARQLWATKSYSRLELVGLYWLEEQISTSSDGPATVKAAGDIVHAANLKFFWIPHFLAYKSYMWKEVGIDAAAFQPNYFFEEMGDERLEDAANIAKRYGMSLELEFDDRMVNDGVFRERFVDYLNSGVETGLMQNGFKAYYQGNNAVYDTALSATPSTRVLYDWLYQFVKGTYQPNDSAPPEVEVRMNGQPLQSGVVVPDTENVRFTWEIQDDDGSGLVQVTAKFDGKPYAAGTEIDLNGKAGKHELSVTAAAGKTKTTSYVIEAGATASGLMKQVDEYRAGGELPNADGYRALKSHLEMMKRFEGRDEAEATKYVKGFNTALDRLRQEQGISPGAYNALKEGVYYTIGSLAQDKPAEASSVEGGLAALAAGKAVDGFPATRWASHTVDDTWFQVDLGDSVEMDTVRIDWEYARAKTFRLLVSDDKQSWRSVTSENGGRLTAQDGKNTIRFEPTKARYIRFVGIERETFYGYSFYEFGVYDLNPKAAIPAIDGLQASIGASSKRVTVEGLSMDGKLVDVNLKVVDPQGNVHDAGKATVAETGGFRIDFPLPGDLQGVYEVWATAEGMNEPAKVSFEYKSDDRTAPVTTAVVTPDRPDGRNGWYRQSVTVTLTARDEASTVTETVYSLDGGTVWHAYTGPLVFAADGTYGVSYRSTDRQGNAEAPQTIRFAVDGTGPVIAIAEPVDGRTYASADEIAAAFTAADDGSGTDEAATVARLDGRPVRAGTAVVLYELELGMHEFTVTAADLAGNIATRTVRFETAAGIDGLKALVERFRSAGRIDNKGIATSLLKKLEAGNVTGFIHEVEAQAGKHISNEAAAVLLRDARAL